jgi:predicted nucleotidyltransferase
LNPRDPNVAKVELVAHALGTLREELIFVGGCAAGLLMSDPATPASRVTYDVDLVVEVAALRDYHRMEAEFTRLGFARDITKDVPICRWRYQELDVDLMPTDARILGFANRWYPLAVTTAEASVLPSGLVVRLISAPLFLATKFEAFADRGKGDILGSHDLEDIISVIDGRAELVDEIAASADELRTYLAARCAGLLAIRDFMNYLPGLVAQDETLSARMATVAERLQNIADLGNPCEKSALPGRRPS